MEDSTEVWTLTLLESRGSSPQRRRALDSVLDSKAKQLPRPSTKPAGSSVQFVGGMLDGKVKYLPTTVDDGPVPLTGYDHGRPVSHWYYLTGWRPDPGVWVYTLTDDARRSNTSA